MEYRWSLAVFVLYFAMKNFRDFKSSRPQDFTHQDIKHRPKPPIVKGSSNAIHVCVSISSSGNSRTVDFRVAVLILCASGVSHSRFILRSQLADFLPSLAPSLPGDVDNVVDITSPRSSVVPLATESPCCSSIVRPAGHLHCILYCTLCTLHVDMQHATRLHTADCRHRSNRLAILATHTDLLPVASRIIIVLLPVDRIHHRIMTQSIRYPLRKR